MVENLSLLSLIYLCTAGKGSSTCWESFIIHLDILKNVCVDIWGPLRIFHYSPWYTYRTQKLDKWIVENLSLFTLIYLEFLNLSCTISWESFIIHLDILSPKMQVAVTLLRIFHYSPWYTYEPHPAGEQFVENLSLFTLIYLHALI